MRRWSWTCRRNDATASGDDSPSAINRSGTPVSESGIVKNESGKRSSARNSTALVWLLQTAFSATANMPGANDSDCATDSRPPWSRIPPPSLRPPIFPVAVAGNLAMVPRAVMRMVATTTGYVFYRRLLSPIQTSGTRQIG